MEKRLQVVIKFGEENYNLSEIASRDICISNPINLSTALQYLVNELQSEVKDHYQFQEFIKGVNGEPTIETNEIKVEGAR